MQPHVLLQIACLVKCGFAYLTGEGLLPCVDADVHCQIALIATTVLTVLAFKYAILIVHCTLVPGEVGLPVEPLVTLITWEWLFTAVK